MDARGGTLGLSDVGKAYYGKHGSEFVISIPCHYMIMRRRDGATLQYRGYFPVSQLSTSLKHRLERALRLEGRARTNMLDLIKTTVLRELDADRGNMIDVEIGDQQAQS